MSGRANHFAAGPLSFRLDPETGFVRDVRFHGHEVLRGIYPAVRDEQWGTITPRVTLRVIEMQPAQVHLRLDGSVGRGEVDFAWTAEIVAEARGTLRYEWEGQARRGFRTNRTGLCVLHPAEAADAACVIEHTDGRRVAGWFPGSISPHQPFTQIRAITHLIAGAAEVETRMEGEVFEMEDQRNWTDASFKTYCRPLSWPRPYELSPGESVKHVVMVSVRGNPPKAAARESTLQLGAATTARLPALGFTITEPLPAPAHERLRALRPAHLRVEATPSDLAANLSWATRACDTFGCELLVALRGAAAPASRDLFPTRCSIHVFDEAGNTVAPAVVEAWRNEGFESLGTGSTHHFTELNRFRPPAHGAHTEVTFGINAQVHAFDDTSLLETLTQHRVVAGHARRLSGDRRLSVAPLTLGPRDHAADPRLHGEFGALWLLGSLLQLATAGIDRVTFARTHGAGGVLNEHSAAPVEALLRTLAQAERVEVFPATAPTLHPFAAVLLTRAGQRELLVPHVGDMPLELHTPWTRPLPLPPRTLSRFPLSP
jgi:D-apionolactonase